MRLRILHKHFILFFLMIFGIKVSHGQSGSDSTSTNSFDNFYFNKECSKENFIYASNVAFNLRSDSFRDNRFIPRTFTYIITFEADADGKITNVQVYTKDQKDKVYVDTKSITSAYSRLVWPICGIPFPLTGKKWQVILPCRMNFSDSYRVMYSLSDEEKIFIQKETYRLTRDHLSIIGPIMFGTYNFG